jgi:hypothetical protein
MDWLPMEMLEMVLMRAFMKLFKDHCTKRNGTEAAYNTLTAVCYNWWQTMNGWPQSSTRLWLKHRLHHHVERGLCRPYSGSPRLHSSIHVSHVMSVAHCEDKLYVVTVGSDTIKVFGPDNEELPGIKVTGLQMPTDIVACSETRHIYVADYSCVWRASLDGLVDKWLPNATTSAIQLRPFKLSLTSRRLLVTSSGSYDLFLFGPDGALLKQITLPGEMNPVIILPGPGQAIRHASETKRGTFVVCWFGTHDKEAQISEVDADGRVMRTFSDPLHLDDPCYLVLDSDGRVFIADYERHYVFLLNNRLQPRRVLIDTCREIHQIYRCTLQRLCFVERTCRMYVTCALRHIILVYELRS